MSDQSTTDLAAIFKAYDVRGLVPEQLDAAGCHAIGAAFARFAIADGAAEGVVVARDMRPSGPELVDAFAEGVMGQGLDVVDIGLASTDMLSFASAHLDLPGAMFTASHNPAGYNGIKMCRRSAGPMSADTGLIEVRDMAAAPPAPVEVAGTRTSMNLLAAFADHVRSFVALDKLAPLKIVADTANGMGGYVVPAVFDDLPFDLEVMYAELDGTFPNHPADPIQPENQRDLQARVLATGADVGLAFDGDADRVFLVDEKGELLSGSLTTAIVAQGVLAREPGATIIHNLICSKTVPAVIAEGGGTAVRSRVGHSFIKQDMADTGAAFGGEHSGHYYFRDNFRADSGLIAALVVLEQLSEAGVALSELRKPFERATASGEINTEVDDPLAVIESVAAAYGDADQDRLDGLTVDLGDWWFNLRPSNTEPLLRLNLEAPDPDACQQRVSEVQALMQNTSA
jgi:phosphomannomutase